MNDTEEDVAVPRKYKTREYNSTDLTDIGIFSKTGKFTSSVYYSVFKKKDEILFNRNRPKAMKITHFFGNEVDIASLMAQKKHIDDSEEEADEKLDAKSDKFDLKERGKQNAIQILKNQ